MNADVDETIGFAPSVSCPVVGGHGEYSSHRVGSGRMVEGGEKKGVPADSLHQSAGLLTTRMLHLRSWLTLVVVKQPETGGPVNRRRQKLAYVRSLAPQSQSVQDECHFQIHAIHRNFVVVNDDLLFLDPRSLYVMNSF
jgi:hypothetical protein